MLDYHLKQPKHSPWSQLAFLLMLGGIGLFAGSFASFGIAKIILHTPLKNLADALEDPANGNVSRLIQFISTFFFLAVPAFVFGSIMSKRPLGYIGFNSALSGKQVFIIIGIVLLGLLLSGALSEVNKLIPISKSAEKYFTGLENEYNKEMLAIANMKSLQDYILSLLIIALLPAIFEEMFFRGALQPVMISLTKNSFAGILITSILFSAIHMSFYGFLPRLALGLMIGYVFYFSKNLWLSSITHFLYNAIGVTQLYALSKQGMLKPDELRDDGFPFYYVLVAAIPLYIIFIFFKKESQVVISMHNISNEVNNEQQL
jgi:membrane protease YdiL (CAAX protease family)